MSARPEPDGPPSSARARSLTHVHPADVSLQAALDAVADPVRRAILRELAGEPDWARACGTFDLPVSKATRSHHFTVLRQAGLLEQRDAGPRRVNRLRRPEFDEAFPGLLELVLREPPAVP
ncbi:ArsR/SmtB family transcription factor [Streptosporangium sp. NPDC003464]